MKALSIALIATLLVGCGPNAQSATDAQPSTGSPSQSELKADWLALTRQMTACSSANDASKAAAEDYKRQMQPLSEAILQVSRQTGGNSFALQPYFNAQTTVNENFEPIFKQIKGEILNSCGSAQKLAKQFLQRIESIEDFTQKSFVVERCHGIAVAYYDSMDLTSGILEGRRSAAEAEGISRRYKSAVGEMPACLRDLSEVGLSLGISKPKLAAAEENEEGPKIEPVPSREQSAVIAAVDGSSDGCGINGHKRIDSILKDRICPNIVSASDAESQAENSSYQYAVTGTLYRNAVSAEGEKGVIALLYSCERTNCHRTTGQTTVVFVPDNGEAYRVMDSVFGSAEFGNLERGLVNVDYMTYGDNDPTCCPSVANRKTILF